MALLLATLARFADGHAAVTQPRPRNAIDAVLTPWSDGVPNPYNTGYKGHGFDPWVHPLPPNGRLALALRSRPDTPSEVGETRVDQSILRKDVSPCPFFPLICRQMVSLPKRHRRL